MNLSAQDLARCSAALRSLYAHRDLRKLRQAILGVVLSLIPTDLAAYNEFQLESKKVTALLNPVCPDVMALVPAFEAHLQQHPQIRHYQQTQDGRAFRISDFLSERQFQALGLYQEFYRVVGIRHQLACFIHEPGELEMGLSLNRSGGDFSERDKAVLDILRPHIMQAYQNALAFTRLQGQVAALSDSLEADGHGVAALTSDGKLAWITPLGTRLLERYFAGARGPGGIPDPLSNWVRQEQASFESERCLGQARQPFTAELPSSRLVVRLAGDGDKGYRLLLSDEQTHRTPATLKRIGLTKREAEVLHWMAEGKTNPEIGIILAVSPRTVQKHVEHILAKIGVENRAAAIRVALEHQ